jgi:hypothetical protein
LDNLDSIHGDELEQRLSDSPVCHHGAQGVVLVDDVMAERTDRMVHVVIVHFVWLFRHFQFPGAPFFGAPFFGLHVWRALQQISPICVRRRDAFSGHIDHLFRA